MPPLLPVILIVLLVFNILSELFSVAVFGILSLGIGMSTKPISKKKHKSVREKRYLLLKNVVGYALMMSLVRIIVPIFIIVNLAKDPVRNIYLFTMLFFIGLEILTYYKLNFKLYTTPRSPNQLNIPYLIIIFICIIGYFG